MKNEIIIIIILISLFELISNSYCGSYIPYDGSSCFQYTNSSSICCFLRGNFEGNYHTMCYPFSRDIYYKMSRTVKINGYSFSVDCGSSRGTLCGDIVNPVSYKDCSIYSKSDNSCCFYKYTYKNPDKISHDESEDDWQTETNCVWLGTGDIGEMSYNKLTVICSSNYLKYSILLLFLIFIMIL